MLRWVMVLGALVLVCRAVAGEPQPPGTQKERESYAIGVDTARGLRQQEVEVDMDALVRGLTDGMSGGKLLMTEQDLAAARSATRKEWLRKQAAKEQAPGAPRKTSAEENRIAGEAFLAENRGKEGVVTLPSGLQYRILDAGDGRKPSDSDVVVCNYRGTFLDGTEFDSTARRGQPMALKVSAVIPGWREALKLMPVGSRWRLFLPPGLAYGAKGSGRIGPNETLVFDMDLLSIK